MRYAVIMAGGSGTRLWPMSRAQQPKQLIPFIDGESLLQIAVDRLKGLVPDGHVYICAGQRHREAILRDVRGADADRYLAEPQGRDTLNAVGYTAAVIGRDDPEAVIGVFTADHLIKPVDRFQRIVRSGYDVAESDARCLVTFGVEPTQAATSYGYLMLGAPVGGAGAGGGQARVVDEFKEKPDARTAGGYLSAGADKFLWNSGMFVWRAAALLDCIRRYEPQNYEGLERIAGAWDGSNRTKVLEEVYPTLKKISVDYAVMEPASRDPQVMVAAVPMPLTWLDVGSWPAFSQTCANDKNGNALAADHHLEVDAKNTLIASSEPGHLIATVGCEDLLIVHTRDATLVCRRDRAEDIRKLHEMVGEKFGGQWV
jgi:mannose-1-phosphate guanylyltransferase